MGMSTHGAGIIEALTRLRERLRSTRLPLPIEGADRADGERRALVGQIEDYLLPRLRQLDAPVLAVVGGSTGAGKSTLVNSLVGRHVSLAGVLRPTTRVPVLVCSPEEIRWFSDDRILPTLTRTTGSTPPPDARGLHLVVDEDVPAGLALLDAPDIDSVVGSNRALAAQLLSAADLWLFVTTAARYADAVPWDFLRAAQARSTSLALVLNRVPPEGENVVPDHLASLLHKEGLADAPLFTIGETELDDGLIPEDEIAPLRQWLGRLVADATARDGIVRTTLQGALDAVESRIPQLAHQLDAQVAAGEDLRRAVGNAYDAARMDVSDALRDGTLLRGEVLSRWQDVIGTGDLMRALESRLGWIRDRVTAAFTGTPPAATEVKVAVERSIETLVVAAADSAAERASASWEASAGGRGLLAAAPAGLDRSSRGFRAEVVDAVRGWQGRVLDLVAAQGASKRAVGRALSLGVNGLGVALMVAMFAHTGGLSGGELAVASGTAALSQKLLEALFGDQAVRDLTAQARADLTATIDELFQTEAARFYALLDPILPTTQEAQELRAAASALHEARS